MMLNVTTAGGFQLESKWSVFEEKDQNTFVRLGRVQGGEPIMALPIDFQR